MEVRVSGPGLAEGGEVTPVDPPPPPDIDDFFELEFLRVSENPVEPFREVEISWSIIPRDTAAFADYTFDLEASGGEELSTGISETGVARFSPYQGTVLRIVGRRGLGGVRSTLGEGLVLGVDESSCLKISQRGQFFNDEVIDRLSRLTSSTAELRLRSRLVGLKPVEMEVQPTWDRGVISYYFPLEVVLPINFFTGDLDVTIEIRFRVRHVGEETNLDATITHSSDVDFDTFQDIVSFGNTASIAGTCDRLIPLILACEARVLERDILRQILGSIDPLLDTHRLLAVRVIPGENAEDGYLELVLCPLPEDGGSGPVVIDPTIET